MTADAAATRAEMRLFDAVVRMYQSGEELPRGFDHRHLAQFPYGETAPDACPLFGGIGYERLDHIYNEHGDLVSFIETWSEAAAAESLSEGQAEAAWDTLYECRAWVNCKQEATPHVHSLLNRIIADASNMAAEVGGPIENAFPPQSWEGIEGELRHGSNQMADPTDALDRAWLRIVPDAPGLFRDVYIENLVLAERATRAFIDTFDVFTSIPFANPPDALTAYRALYRLRDLSLIQSLIANTLEAHIDTLAAFRA